MTRGKKAEIVTPAPDRMQATMSSRLMPMVVLLPGPDGTRLDVFGLTAAQAMDELRLALLHLAVMQAEGVVLREVVRRETAIAPAARPSANGTDPGRRRLTAPVRTGGRQRRVSDVDADLDDDEMDAWDIRDLMGS